ncbi:MAG: family 43 glycosylhydrolase, partial [Bacteroidales bacterium]|nr:family 43 glycosylhydrolase [Bacteroidales bacterium]
MRRLLLLPILLLLLSAVPAGLQAQIRYFNPVLHMDYSDPDVCRVGEDYYMTASSFNCFPGLPILHSRDLVNWTPVGAALTDYAEEFHTSVQHGNGVWAPAIRYHDGWFYIFCGDPDRGIFMVRTQDPRGRWEAPVWVVKAKGFIDPCPLWDDDGTAWLSHAAAGSRAGLKSVVFVAPMAPDGTHLLGPSRIVFDGHKTQPTIEGTKLYKRDGWYYIFAPAGGVKTGWQTVLRAKHPYGPYEERIVMAAAEGTINGPHQGAWVETPAGESWFLHFQDKGAYGRIVHLQPMAWRSDGWPVIGDDPDGDGVGQPVESWLAPYGIPNAVPTAKTPGQAGGDVRASTGPYGLPLEWQYPAVPSPYWHYALPDGGIRLYSVEQKPSTDWRDVPNLLLQKFPAERFVVSAKLVFHPNPQLGNRLESAGFLVSGDEVAGFNLIADEGGAQLDFLNNQTLEAVTGAPIPYDDNREATLWVKLEVRAKATGTPVPEARCRFSYSLDGKRYVRVGPDFTAVPGRWIGAKFGFFCNRYAPKNDAGWLDVLDLRVVPEFDPLEGFNYDESKVPEYTLPELLRLDNGKAVTDVKTWEKKRRPELLALFEDQMYGKAPAAPEALHFKLLSEDSGAFGGLATRKEIRVCFDAAEKEYLTLLLYVPNQRSAPAPCFLGVNFFGNHTTSTDPGVSLPDSTRYRSDFTLDARGSQALRWPIETILQRGYAVATFCCEDVDPDVDDGFRNGVHGLLGPAQRTGGDWGTLAAWAWGLS